MKKFLLIVVSLLVCVPSLRADVSAATTLKEFLNQIQKGETKTYSGEVVCSYNDGYYLYLQDETAGLRASAYGKNIAQGDKLKNVEFALSRYGAQIISINTFDVVEKGVTITPKTVPFADLDDYNFMLVRVEGLTFANAGYKFEMDTNNECLKESVSQGRTSGYVWPINGNIVGSVIPEKANVTGLANIDLVIRPRSLADIDVVDAGDEQEDNFARFLDKMTHYGTDVYNGELLVSYSQRMGSVVTLIVQDDSAGVYSYVTSTSLKAGDKIKDVKITMVSANGRYTIDSFTLVSRGNEITPKVITAHDMGDNSPYSYMMVKVENVGIQASESGLYTINGTYPILTDGANVESALLSTAFCPEMVGNTIPASADLTGILFFGFEVRPVSLEGVVAKGDMSVAKIDDCATVSDVRKSKSDVIRLAGPVDVSYIINQTGGYGTVYMQDETGGLQVSLMNITPEVLKQGTQLSNVSLNLYDKSLVMSRIEGKVAEVTAEDVVIKPRVITLGSFNSGTRAQLENTLIEYEGVRFVESEPTFSQMYTYVVSDGTTFADVYPYEALNGKDVPTGEVNVVGLALYNTDLGKYFIRPREMSDITVADPSRPRITLSALSMDLKAEVGNESSKSVEVTATNCTKDITISRAANSATQQIIPDKTSLTPSSEPQTVTFTFKAEKVGTVVETFEFTTDGLSNPAVLTVTASGEAGIQIISADADGFYRVYAPTGVKVLDTRDASSISTLPAGLYIVNGRKLIIR